MAKRRRKRILLSDQLREIIRNAPESRYRLSVVTGISESTLSRFVSGERGLSIEAMDALGDFFELELVSRRAPGQSSPDGP